MSKNITSVLALFFASFFVASGVQGEQAKTTLWFGPPQIVIDGTRLVESDDVDKGMAKLTEALDLSLEPMTMAMVYTNLCMGHVRKQQFAEALDQCERALKVRPGQWEAINNRGCAHLGLGNVAEAVRDFTRASMLNPDNQDIMLNLTMAIDARNKTRPLKDAE